MSLLRRITNIIKSNINHKKEGVNINIDIDINSYDDLYYEDCKESKKAVNKEDELERKYYKALEVEYGSDFTTIKKAYKKLLKKYHPDLFQNKPEKLKSAQEVTRQINEAYTYFEKRFL